MPQNNIPNENNEDENDSSGSLDHLKAYTLIAIAALLGIAILGPATLLLILVGSIAYYVAFSEQVAATVANYTLWYHTHQGSLIGAAVGFVYGGGSLLTAAVGAYTGSFFNSDTFLARRYHDLIEAPSLVGRILPQPILHPVATLQRLNPIPPIRTLWSSMIQRISFRSPSVLATPALSYPLPEAEEAEEAAEVKIEEKKEEIPALIEHTEPKPERESQNPSVIREEILAPQPAPILNQRRRSARLAHREAVAQEAARREEARLAAERENNVSTWRRYWNAFLTIGDT